MKKLWLAAPVLVLVGACATMMTGTDEVLTFDSEPRAADVYVDGTLRGQTPCTVGLPKRGSYNVRFQKEGYQPHEFVIRAHTEGWVVGNVMTLGLGVLVDAATGAINRVPEKHIFVRLMPR